MLNPTSHDTSWRQVLWINRNMRCIEMRAMKFLFACCNRLIETWDVLKLTKISRLGDAKRLIETWDVLKLARRIFCLCCAND